MHRQDAVGKLLENIDASGSDKLSLLEDSSCSIMRITLQPMTRLKQSIAVGLMPFLFSF